MKRFIYTFFVLVSCVLLNGVSPFGSGVFAQTFDGVSVNVKDGTITGTNATWEYAITAPDGSGASWDACDATITNFTPLDTGNFYVQLRVSADHLDDSVLLKVPPQRIAPGYTINYKTEDAGVLDPADEFSWYADMSASTQGNGTLKIDLDVDGALDTVYVRTLATDSTVSSRIQKIYVPNRPAVPFFTINYIAKTTGEIVETTTRWSEFSDLSVSASGSGMAFDISSFIGDVQDTLFFEHEAIDGTRFKSNVGELIIKRRQDAPLVTVDFVNEQTGELIPSTMEWSESKNMSGANVGTGGKVLLSTFIGAVQDTLFFRNKATDSDFASGVSELIIPVRPATPFFSVNYADEETLESVTSNQEYSTLPGMSSVTVGTGNAIALTPGQDLYLRNKAIALTSFKSEAFWLKVKSRPVAPNASLNYLNETLISLPSDAEWDTGSGYTDVNEGASIREIIPASGAGSDKDIYVRQKSIGNEFSSEIQTIPLERRNPAPSIGTHNDDTNIITWTGITGFTIASEYEYSTSNGSSWATCPGYSIDVDNIAIPSGDFQIRLKASAVSGSERFAGEVVASNFVMTSVGESNLAVVGISVVDERLSGTSTDMEYAIKKAAESDSAWVVCTNTYTAIPIDALGDFKVYVRQKSLPENSVLVKNVPARALPPAYTIDFYSEKTAQIIPATDEYTWTYDSFGIQGSGSQLDLKSQIGSSEKILYLRTKATDNKVASEPQALTIPARPVVTSYTVNFDAETTDQPVPGTDIYSTSPDMSSAVVGPNSNLALTPGTDVYFQTPYLAGDHFKSEIYHLVVPDRPVINFSVNYANETTNEDVPATVNWAEDAGMSSVSSGTDGKLSLTPGTDIWLQKQHSSSDFRSDVFYLHVIARPATPTTAIDFVNEILTGVTGTPQWNATGSFTTVFNNQNLKSYIEGSAGNNKTIAIKYPSTSSSFESEIQTLILPKRETSPLISEADYDDNLNRFTFSMISGFSVVTEYEFTIDGGSNWQSCSALTQSVGDNSIGIGELRVRLKASNITGTKRFAGESALSTQAFTSVGTTDLDAVGLDVADKELYGTRTDMEYSIDKGSMGPWLSCNNGKTAISIDPLGDFTVHIRQASMTENQQEVTYVAPARSAPEYGIDYINETTDRVIPITDEYSWDNINFIYNGSGVKMDLSGVIGSTAKSLYLRNEATEDEVASVVKNLSIKARPVIPSYEINYGLEKTSISVDFAIFHSSSSDMSGSTQGQGIPVDLTPGIDKYFQQPASVSSFRSLIYFLNVPDRPAISYTVDYVNESTNEVVPAGVQYDDNADMLSPTEGTGGKLTLTPGTNQWFKQTATASSFASAVFELSVPSRPSTPNALIDYLGEKLTSVPSSGEWDASGTYQAVGENQILSSYIPSASSGSDKLINIRVSSNGTSFASTPQSISLPKRNPAPVITDHDDMNNTVTFLAVTGYSAAASYEISIDDGDSWSTCTSFTQNVGNVDIPTGKLKIRLKASDSSKRFSGEWVTSNFAMTFTDDLPLDGVGVLVSSNLMTGTTTQMEYALKLGTNPITSWSICSHIFTPIAIPVSGNLEVHVRQASNTNNSRMVKAIPAAATAPDYSIDFSNETTNQVIPSTDEYTWVSGLFGVPGTGIKLALSGEIGATDKILYLRTKATYDLVASQVKELVVPARPVVTPYSIDFINEKTNEAVPPTDRYSTASNMSGAFSGSNQTIVVEPGVTLYFRTPATGVAFASEIYPLTVPVRPSVNFTINYTNESTNETLTSGMEWDDNASMSSPTSGLNTVHTITPGEDVWFRKKAVASTSFASEVFHLVVPDRANAPETVINYFTEKLTSVPAGAVWNMAGAFQSVSENANLTPYIPGSSGINKNVIVKIASTALAFASYEQTLSLKKRVSAPIITAHDDDLNTFTFSPVSGFSNATEYEYSVDGGTVWAGCSGFTPTVGDIDILVGNLKVRLKASNASGSERFAGEAVSSNFEMTQVGTVSLGSVVLLVNSGLLTGTSSDMEYAIKPGGSSFGSWLTCNAGLTTISIDPDGNFEVHVRQASNVSNTVLVKSVPAAANAPNYTIDYFNETTAQIIPATDEYSWTDQSFSLSGSGIKLDISPKVGPSATALYIRTKATIDKVASKTQTLTIPARPVVPTYTINYGGERTAQIVSAAIQYATSSNMSGAVSGTGATIALNPGQNLYFKQAASSSSFASDVYTLIVPARPTINFSVNYVTEKTNEVVSSGVEWDDNSGMSSPSNGSNVELALTPGTDIWLRKKAVTGTAFASDIFPLSVPDRPAAPETEIDWINEKLISVPINAQWNASGAYSPVVENQTLTSYIPASTGSNKTIDLRISSSGSSFASQTQSHVLFKRKQAPLITNHDDDLNTFTFSALTGYASASNYEYSVNGGIIWTVCTGFTQNVGDIDIPAGNLKLRLKASNITGSERFSGEIASSDFNMTQVGAVALESVILFVNSGFMTGTLTEMAYAIKPTGEDFEPWTTCSAGVTFVDIDPDGDFEVYVRQISNITNSRMVKFVPPAADAPDYTIDFTNEKTQQVIPATDEYTWSAGAFGVSGTGAKLDISQQIGNVSRQLYIRTKATIDKVASQVRVLAVPARPVMPVYSVNYETERTWESVSSAVSYSTLNNMSGAVAGSGSTVQLTPGVNLYFYQPATNNSFASQIFELEVSSRPSISFSIDYLTERTLQTVTTDIEWDDNASMTSPESGQGNKLDLSPGTDLWFRKQATVSSFRSTTFKLTVPDRPSAPFYELDYLNERTTAVVPTSQEWANQYNMIGATGGADTYVSLSPGTNYYFRKKSTSGSFASLPSPVLIVPARPLINYSVDYINETTTNGIPSTDIWSLSASMTSAVTGNGAKLNLTPGTDVYIKRKAVAGTSLASEVFVLDVPSRPSTPEVLLDYVNEKTNIVIPSQWEWSNASNMSGSSVGPDDFMDLFPSRNYYFRKKSTVSSFSSEISSALNVPARPVLSYSINYQAAQTNEAVASNVIYANNEYLYSPSIGGGSPVKLTPGTDIWFKQTAVPNVSLASAIYKLTVPGPPSSVSYGIDFVNERTNSTVASTVEWSKSADMNGSTSGTNAYLSLTPGDIYYFRKKPTSTSFASAITELDVPARPGISYSIDYLQETTNQVISTEDKWSYNSSMTSSTMGNGQVLALTPGKDLWFQKVAIANQSFASEILHLVVANRPAVPVYTLDYVNEKTKENVGSDVDWSVQSDMSSAQPGSNSPLKVVPSTSYYFRKRATAGSFSSLISTALSVPARPLISFSVNYETETTNENVSTGIEYANSADMASTTKGTGGKLALNPGTNLWFIKPAVQNVSLASSIFYLNVPARPATPQAVINYVGEVITNVPPSCQWDLNGSFEALANNTVLTPHIPAYGNSNKTVSLKIPQASKSFASLEQLIVIPARNRAPQINTYDDISIPNLFGWSGIAGFANASDYEYNINNTSWDECDGFNQEIPADIEILAGDLSLRLAASNATGKERFAGEEVVSNTTFSGEKSISLSYIAINLISGQITGTSSKLEYSLNATDWDNGTWLTASNGNTNVSFDMNGGFFVMVRQKGLESNRRVVIEVKPPADAPNYGINYFNETLDNPLQLTDEMTWNSNQTGFVSGDGVMAPALNVTAAQKTLYLRTKITETTVPSKVQELIIPARETLTYTIDYVNESTLELIGLDVEYGYDSALSSPLSGEDKVLLLKPEQDVWFRRLASDKEFKSAISKLEVPARYVPTPVFSIDYDNLMTSETVSSTIKYWEQSNPDVVLTGGNGNVDVEPGNSLFFQHVAENNRFASEVFELVVPFRPNKPSPVINYKEESLRNIGDLCEWNVNGNYTEISNGQSIRDFIPEENGPGEALPIRLRATITAFASEDTLLTLSPRPPSPKFITYDDEGDSATWEYVAGYENYMLYEYSINNGLSWIDCVGKTLYIGDVHVAKGELQLRLKANTTVGSEHFAGSKAYSDQEFRAITLLLYDDVKADISKGILTGTSYEMEYSLNSTIGLDGTWVTATDDTTFIDYPLGGGYKIFVRQKGKETNFGHILDVRFALSAPEFGIDFANETLSEIIVDTVEVAKKADMSDAEKGQGEAYLLSPGVDSVLYIRYASTAVRVPSKIQTLRIPNRREAPVFTIDYWNEASNEEVSNKIEFSEDPLMQEPFSGMGFRVSVNPKEEIDSIFFRYKSTDTSFVSKTFTLVVPALTPTPEVKINYEEETVYNVPINCEWNVTGQFNLVSEGQSLKDYIPTSAQGFRKVDVRVPASGSSFASGTAILRINPRSKAPSISTYDDYLNIIAWNPVSGVTDPLAYEISIDSGMIWEKVNAFEKNVGDTVIETGDILIRVAASNTYAYFEGDMSASTKPFSKSEAISFEAVEADISKNMLRGTTPSMEYSITSSDGSDGEWIIITGESVEIDYPLEGGFKIYARQIDEPRNVSLILDVLPAGNPPAYSIDYFNERINKPFATNVEYSWYSDMADALKGDGSSVLKLYPTDKDTILYIRYVSTESTVPSNMLPLKIPSRPGAQLSIDFENETTQERLNQLIVWSTDKDFTFLNGGTNAVIPMIPGVSIWYRQLASGLSFVSDTFKLESPIRPLPPMYSIDYLEESTVETVEERMVYSDNAEMINPITGPNLPVILTPGQNLWFTVAATDTSYASEPFELEIPARPDGPSFASIDFEDEQLINLNDSLEVVYDHEKYAVTGTSFDISRFISAQEELFNVRYPSDGISYFASESFDVYAPGRPELPLISLVHIISDQGRFEINGERATRDAGLQYQVDGGDWIDIDESTLVTLGGDHTILVRKPATPISFESLHSLNLNSRLDPQLIDMIVVDGNFDSHLYIGGVQHYTDNRVRIYTRWGQEIYDANNYQNEFDFRDYPAGTYYYLISYTDEDGVRRELRNFVEVIKKQ